MNVLTIFLSVFLSCSPVIAGDTGIRADLDSLANEYLSAIDRLSPEAACSEVDYMIGSTVSDSLRNVIAVRAYRHFRESKVMGSENVAVHIYDRWFATFKAVFPDLTELDEAEMYAFVNRRSLLGKTAQCLEMTSMEGENVSFPTYGKYSVVYFYSAECPKCLLISREMKDHFAKRQWKKEACRKVKATGINVFAVYTGTDKVKWQEYVQKNLSVRGDCKVKIFHLQVPQEGTPGSGDDFVSAYGVIQTPRLFLIDPKGKIIGRGLDIPALKLLCGSACPRQ